MPSTLLLADDSVTIQRVIELTFADEDIKVVAVSDGDQAIARLEAQPPDIVLADVGMPGKSGYDVAQYVKQSPRLAHIPVVLLTGAFEPVDQARASQAGCDGVLAKPFEPQLVISRVKELLGQPKEHATPPAEPDAAPSPLAAAPLQTAAAFDHDVQPPAQSAPIDASADNADLATYFDRLDAAFANLSHPPAPHHAAPAEPFAGDSLQAPEPPPAAHAVPPDIDWFGPRGGETTDLPLLAPQSLETHDAAQASEPAQVPLAPASAEALEVPLAPAPAQAPHESEELEASETTRAPQVSEAIEAQAPVEAGPPEAPHAPDASETPAFALPEKPVALPPLADAFAALLAAEEGNPTSAAVAWPAASPSTDALVDQISRRVLDQISGRLDASVRGAVADLVADVAERLVREEIERIRATIK